MDKSKNSEMDPENIARRRRSSILKPQKARNPFSEVDLSEPSSADITKSSRRVSFAGSNFVKPFAADPEKNTIWDTTYEEMVNHTDTSSIVKATDVFNASSVFHEEKENYEICTDDETIAGQKSVYMSQTMELTKCVSPTTEQVFFKTNSNNMNLTQCANLISQNHTAYNNTMELTCQVQSTCTNKTLVCNNISASLKEDMEFTCQYSSVSSNETHKLHRKTEISGIENLPPVKTTHFSESSDDLELTLPVTNYIRAEPTKNIAKIQENINNPTNTKISHKANIANNFEMDFTCQSSLVGNVPVITTGSNFFFNDMEFTLPASDRSMETMTLMPKKIIYTQETDLKNSNSSVRDKNTLDGNRISIWDKKPECFIEDMEFTCQIPSVDRLKHTQRKSGIENQPPVVDSEFNMSVTDDMEFTLTGEKDLEKTFHPKDVTDNFEMEFTCQIPSVENEAIHNFNRMQRKSGIENQPPVKTTQFVEDIKLINLDDVESSNSLQIATSVIKNKSNIKQTTDFANLSGVKDKNALKMNFCESNKENVIIPRNIDDFDMEFTCQLPSINNVTKRTPCKSETKNLPVKSTKFNVSIEDDMELTLPGKKITNCNQIFKQNTLMPTNNDFKCSSKDRGEVETNNEKNHLENTCKSEVMEDDFAMEYTCQFSSTVDVKHENIEVKNTSPVKTINSNVFSGGMKLGEESKNGNQNQNYVNIQKNVIDLTDDESYYMKDQIANKNNKIHSSNIVPAKNLVEKDSMCQSASISKDALINLETKNDKGQIKIPLQHKISLTERYINYSSSTDMELTVPLPFKKQKMNINQTVSPEKKVDRINISSFLMEEIPSFFKTEGQSSLGKINETEVSVPHLTLFDTDVSNFETNFKIVETTSLLTKPDEIIVKNKSHAQEKHDSINVESADTKSIFKNQVPMAKSEICATTFVKNKTSSCLAEPQTLEVNPIITDEVPSITPNKSEATFVKNNTYVVNSEISQHSFNLIVEDVEEVSTTLLPKNSVSNSIINNQISKTNSDCDVKNVLDFTEIIDISDSEIKKIMDASEISLVNQEFSFTSPGKKISAADLMAQFDIKFSNMNLNFEDCSEIYKNIDKNLREQAVLENEISVILNKFNKVVSSFKPLDFMQIYKNSKLEEIEEIAVVAPSIPTLASPVKQKSVHEKICEAAKESNPHWILEKSENETYYFSSLFKNILFAVKLNPCNGIINNIKVNTNLEGITRPRACFNAKYFEEKLDSAHLVSVLGPKYDILTLLDYVYLTMDEVNDMHMEYEKLLNDFKTLGIKMDSDFRISFKILNIELIIFWEIVILMSPNFIITKNNVTVRDCLNRVPVDEEYIKGLVEGIPKDIYFLRHFVEKVVKYYKSIAGKIVPRRKLDLQL